MDVALIRQAFQNFDPISVLLVDDSQLFLRLATRYLRQQPWIDVVGWAHTGAEALQQVQLLRPAAVLLDISMVGMSGLETCRHIKMQPGAPYVVMLTLYETREYREAAASLGSDEFVSKAEFGTQLIPLLAQLRARSAGRAGGA